jgi:hypothetical protein
MLEARAMTDGSLPLLIMFARRKYHCRHKIDSVTNILQLGHIENGKVGWLLF